MTFWEMLYQFGFWQWIGILLLAWVVFVSLAEGLARCGKTHSIKIEPNVPPKKGDS